MVNFSASLLPKLSTASVRCTVRPLPLAGADAVTYPHTACGEFALYGQNGLSGTAKTRIVIFSGLRAQKVGVRVSSADIDQKIDCLAEPVLQADGGEIIFGVRRFEFRPIESKVQPAGGLFPPLTQVMGDNSSLFHKFSNFDYQDLLHPICLLNN